ncbi:hypothetical protein [Knoellia koreensis]|uniref:Phospholipase A2 n=1 Tax=Knoellia koreensis TaxID=2730921 RepID=A0A849HCN5_9MICO|nr:hypothetical protein [Knoellia sp. DB2414S]NNM45695.1 hypothetical protein [Knoellia sp. DB2414S]
MKTATKYLTICLVIGTCLWAMLESPQALGGRDGTETASAVAVDALVHEPGERAEVTIPRGFGRAMGYAPRLQQGLLVDPTGECSGPLPLPASFDAVCRRHDLGYDLLRYADESGQPLPTSARRAIDDQFDAGLHAACTSGDWSCVALADTASAAVRVNSWRQHWAAPWHETPASIVQAASGITVLLSALGLAGVGLGRLRPRRLRRPVAAIATTSAVSA